MKGIIWASLALLLVPGLLHAQDAVFRMLPSERLEKFLKEQKIDFKKSSSPVSKDDIHFYDFMRDKFQVRLSSFGGKDLMLDCVFGPLYLSSINTWNIQAKFSRATSHKGAKGDALSTLEYNLDLTGGATEDTVKQFLLRFDQELKDYDAFVISNGSDTKILASVPDERIETVLKSLNITWTKKPGPSDGPTVFDFEIDKQPIRLRNYAGKEILMAAKFSPVKLEAINEYNLSRKFIRAVNYKTKDNSDLSVLEAAFDCEPGVSEGMVRHFVLTFVEDAKHFGAYGQDLSKKSASSK